MPVLVLLALLTTAARGEEASCPQLDPGLLSPSPDNKLVVTANQIEGASGSLSTLQGAVRLQLGNREFSADALQYDDSKRLVLANAPSRFRNQDYLVLSRSASYDLADESGIFRESEFTLLERGARGNAKEMVIEKSGHASFSDIRYTSCAPGRNGWQLSAAGLRLDQDTGMGVAHNAVLRLGGVPVLYTPYIQFPIDDRRHTGLLFPTVGNNTRTGFDARWPLYLNLAPNYDAVITPRFMSDRGVQLAASGRYLSERSTGSANLEYLSRDTRFNDESRGLTELQYEYLINNRISAHLQYAEASDPNYFEDLSFVPDLSTNTYLKSSARVVYQAPSAYTVQAMVQRFQPLAGTQSVDDPYQRLPEVRFDGATRSDLLGARLGLNAEATNFVRQNSVQGFRQVVVPHINWTQDAGGYYGAVQTDLHLTRYQLRDAANLALDDHQRSLPVVSGDAGLRFARTGSDGGLQILEPRLFYLFAPYRNQNVLPIFDAGQSDYDFPQLFARNRFIGQDRIADANQLTTALTYRMLDPAEGATRFIASFGQIYRFESSRVSAPGLAPANTGSSDYLASGEWRINEKLSTTSLLQLSPESGQFSRTNFALRYRDARYRADLGYRYRSGLLQQIDASGALPLGNSIRAASRLRYSPREDRLLDALVGLEYETCCYAIQAAYRRYLVNSSGDIDSGIFFQLDLKGLSRLGTGFEELLTGNNRPLGDD